VLVAVGNTDPVAYGLALCLGPVVAALLTARRAGPPAGGNRADLPTIARLSRDVGLLLVASALAMVLANLAPVVVTAMLPDDPATAAGFAGAVVLTRVPLLFMGPIQALLLPGMTASAASGDARHLRVTLARGCGVIAALGIVAVVGTWFLGRPVIALLFGADRDTTESVPLVVLTASAAVFMAVLLLQSALVALRRHRALVLAWVAGAVAFALCFAIPLAPVDQGVLAQITGPVVTLAAQLAVLSRYLRVGAAATTPATG
jgi:O-antigen/teichoic acid export membrane protein